MNHLLYCLPPWRAPSLKTLFDIAFILALLLPLSAARAENSPVCNEVLTAEQALAQLEKIALETMLTLKPDQAQTVMNDLRKIAQWGLSKGLTPNAIGLAASGEGSFFLGGRDDFKVAVIPHGCNRVNIVVLNAPGIEVGIGAGASVSGAMSLNFNVNDNGRMDGYTAAAGAAVTAITGVGAFGFFSVFPSDAPLIAELVATNLTHDEVTEAEVLQKLMSNKRSFGFGASWGVGFGGKFIALVGKNTELKRMTVDEDQVPAVIKSLFTPKSNPGD